MYNFNTRQRSKKEHNYKTKCINQQWFAKFTKKQKSTKRINKIHELTKCNMKIAKNYNVTY